MTNHFTNHVKLTVHPIKNSRKNKKRHDKVLKWII